MCGIAGLVKKDGTKVFVGEIKAMTDALIHRGRMMKGITCGEISD